MAKRRLLVGGRKKPVSAKSIVEKAVGRDFRRLTAKYAAKISKGGTDLLDFASKPPKAREHAFAKVPGKKIVGASLRKYPNHCIMRKLRPGEKFVSHVHDINTTISVPDLCQFIELVHDHGKITYFFDYMDLGAGYNEFQRKAHTAWISAIDKGPKGRGTLSRMLQESGKAAAKQFAVGGRVFAQPTQLLLEMPESKMQKLLSYLEEKAKEITDQRITKAKYLRWGPNWREKLRLNVNRFIARNYGQLFSFRVVAMPGYRHDKKNKQFVKIK
jgi:hypothetical protein